MITEQELIELGFEQKESNKNIFTKDLNHWPDKICFNFYPSKKGMKQEVFLFIVSGDSIDLQFKNKEQLKTFMECFKYE